MKEMIPTLIGIAVAFILVYFTYYIFKSLSYSFFYEDMVIKTVREMVKPEYLLK